MQDENINTQNSGVTGGDDLSKSQQMAIDALHPDVDAAKAEDAEQSQTTGGVAPQSAGVAPHVGGATPQVARPIGAAQPARPAQPAQPTTSAQSSQPTQPLASNPTAPLQQPAQAAGANPDSTAARPIAGGYAAQGSTAANTTARGTSWYGTQPQPQVQAPAKKSSPSKAKTFIWGIAGVVVGAALVVALMFGTGALGAQSTGNTQTGTISITSSTTSADTAEAVAAKCLPSVVSIDIYTTTTSSSIGSWLGIGNSNQQQQSSETLAGYGSGVIIRSDGYIITNFHVTNEGNKYIIHFYDDSTAEATLVGSDESSDLAVLKVEKTGLTAMDIGSSGDVAVGEWVMTIGSPFGLTKSVSAGIVSALYRNETLNNSSTGTSIYCNMIQVDAGVNPGNSGGALVDEEGKLIGINVMTASYSGDFSGVGFAIPIDYAMNIANQLIENGVAQHPYLGVKLGTVDASTKDYYNVGVDQGAYVGEVVTGSPAEAAGLQKGDVIVTFNGEEVASSTALMIDIRQKNIGDEVTLGVYRDGKLISINATLQSDQTNGDSE